MNKTYFESKDNILIEDIDKNVILNLENELENTEKQIKTITENIKKLKRDKEEKKFMNCCLIIIEFIIATIGSFNSVHVLFTLIYTLIIFSTFKLIDKSAYKTFSEINKELNKLKIKKEIYLADYEDIEKKLHKIKDLSNLKNEDITFTNNIDYSMENNKAKKLILTKPNED